jgi:hypothetical protein
LKALPWSLIPGDLIRFPAWRARRKWHASDGTLTDYLLEKDIALGVPKVALPVFMLGGLWTH